MFKIWLLFLPVKSEIGIRGLSQILLTFGYFFEPVK